MYIQMAATIGARRETMVALRWGNVDLKANRIIFDVPADLNPEQAVRLMELVDRAVYSVPAAASGAAVHRLQALDVPARGWRDKITIAWLLEGGTPVARMDIPTRMLTKDNAAEFADDPQVTGK